MREGQSTEMSAKTTFGLIIGNRGFSPNHLARSGREEMIHVLQSAVGRLPHGFRVVSRRLQGRRDTPFHNFHGTEKVARHNAWRRRPTAAFPHRRESSKSRTPAGLQG